VADSSYRLAKSLGNDLYAYITGVLPGGEQIPLFRLRYGGSAHSFGFAIYSPARSGALNSGIPSDPECRYGLSACAIGASPAAAG
jgi:hypothetical protein